MMGAFGRSNDQVNAINVWEQHFGSTALAELNTRHLCIREVILVGPSRDIPSIDGANYVSASIARPPSAAATTTKEVYRP